ncbi:MAG TPA: glycosyltransferase family A protein, partial [Acidimicrobiales bacterium]|nr:glycosyltransferase family A protein [Acidimicrobiales bacterium]
MPWRRGDASSPRPRPGSGHPGFRPIRLVRVDVDAPRVEGRLDTDRVWIEATRGGHVVGLVDARAHDGALSEGLLEGLATAFSDRDDPVAGGDSVPDERLPRLSVVVPTLGAHPERLARTVESILACEYPSVEVVVVDNRRGTPATAVAELGDDERVRVVREATPGISAARNRGVAASTGDVVAFTDDDVVVDPGWLRALGARFAAEPDVDGLGGLVLPSELDTEPQLWFEEYYGGFSQSFRPSTVSVAATLATDALFPYAPGRFGAGCNMAFRRATL